MKQLEIYCNAVHVIKQGIVNIDTRFRGTCVLHRTSYHSLYVNLDCLSRQSSLDWTARSNQKKLDRDYPWQVVQGGPGCLFGTLTREKSYSIRRIHKNLAFRLEIIFKINVTLTRTWAPLAGWLQSRTKIFNSI